MALTCTIYENNFKSEVMKSNNQKQKKVSKISLSGGQGFVNCQCRKGNCKSGRCKCQG
jgi:hypothetical protein